MRWDDDDFVVDYCWNWFVKKKNMKLVLGLRGKNKKHEGRNQSTRWRRRGEKNWNF